MEQAMEHYEALREATMKREHLDRRTENQLCAALYPLNGIWSFLTKLEEKGNSMLYAQISPLFIQACDGIQKILPHIKEQGSLTSDTVGMISDLVQQKFKPEIILEIINASKPSITPSIITMQTVKPVRALLKGVASLLEQKSSNKTRDGLISRLISASCFLWHTANQCIKHEKMKDLFSHAVDVAYTAANIAFLNLHSTLKEEQATKFLERTSPFRPELRQIYGSVFILLKSAKTGDMSDLFWALEMHAQELLSHKGSLKADFGEKIYSLEKGLRKAYDYYKLIRSENVFKDLDSCKSHEIALAIEAGMLIYSLFDEEKANYPDLIPLLSKLNHVAVYTKVIYLLNGKSKKYGKPADPLKDLALCFKEELIFLRTFLMFSLDQCAKQSKLTEVLTLVHSLTTEAWSAIKSFCKRSKKDSLALEISLCQFRLLFKLQFLKAVIRQIHQTISASSEPAHPMKTPLNYLPVNFDVIDSYFNELKSLKTPSSTGSQNMYEVLLGFHDYTLKNMLLKVDLEFTDTDYLRRFHHGFLLLVTILPDLPNQYIECGKQKDLLKKVGSIAIEAEDALSLCYEDALDSNTSRKVNFMLRLVRVATKLVKSEDNLMDLQNHRPSLEAQIMDIVKNAHEELIFLREFLMDLLKQRRELDKFGDVLRRSEDAANEASLISIISCESFMDGSSTWIISDFLREVKSVKVALRQVCRQILDTSLCNTTLTDVKGLINFLLNHPDRVLDRDAGSIIFLKERIPVIKEELELLSPFYGDIIRHHNMHQQLQDLVKHIQDSGADTKYVLFFFVKGYRPAWYDMLYLSDVRQLLKFVEKKVSTIILKVPDSSSYSFPRTNGLGFLDWLLGKLKEILCSNFDPIIALKKQIESVKDELFCLRSQFVDNYDEHGEVCGLVTSVTEMAYKVEFIIDSCIVNSYPLWYKGIWISKAIETIKSLNKVVRETCGRSNRDVAVFKVEKTNICFERSLSADTPRLSEEMKSFQDAMDKIMQQLTGGSPQLDVISLVGMPGIGKTTLAEKIYNDPRVTSHFDVRAQCRATQVYSRRDLFLTILNDLQQEVDPTKKDDGELANKLRQILFHRRFLILIDDVWDNGVWENLNMCFTGSESGSRIILTTRLIDIANNVKCGSDPHHLHLLKDDESWTLLQDQVFQGEDCPRVLKDVGMQIAKSCGGLPLLIVLVAGVLKEKKKQAALWKEVEEHLAAQNLGSLDESLKPIIGFSYKNLPDYLKPCFLYFGGLVKDKDIHVSKLTQLWMSEGFVQPPEEDAAQKYLDDLISRNLVMVVKKRPNGKVKICSIHDVLHKFCLEEAKQENLFLRINGFSGEDTYPEKLEAYRLFVHSSQDQIDHWKPSQSNIRSLIINAIALDMPSDISFIFDKFKLVKVLDLKSFNIGDIFPSAVQYLILLRYFAVMTSATLIPTSIAKLWNLEMFVVWGLGGKVILPSSILKMVKLRHILVKPCASFSQQENMGETLDTSQLDKLKTFSCPYLSYGQDSETILRKMPNLRKLSCKFSGKVEGSLALFPRFHDLSHLESLKLVSDGLSRSLQHVFNFPSNVRELTLSKFRLPWSQISTVRELPNLEVLKLVFKAFEGEHWEVDNSGFPELKYLELNNLNIEQWSVSEDAFPKLECLVLTKCEKLKEIPSQFSESLSLERIDISWCSSSVANSARDIKTTQLNNYGRDTLSVTVPSSSDLQTKVE